MASGEHLLGLADLLPQQEVNTFVAPPEQSTVANTAFDSALSAQIDQRSTKLELESLLPNGAPSAEALTQMLRIEGSKCVDAKLKLAGLNSVGKRLKAISVLQILASSAAAPQAAGAGAAAAAALQPTPGQILDEARRNGHDVDALLTLAAQRDISDPGSVQVSVPGQCPPPQALSAELRRLGLKTGARLKLEQALMAAVKAAAVREAQAEQQRIEAARLAVIEEHRARDRQAREEARAAAVEEHRRRDREARDALRARDAEARAAAEAEAEASAEAQRQHMADLYEQYQRETMSEVDKLKAERKRANAAKREAAEEESERAVSSAGPAAEQLDRPLSPLLVDAAGGDGGVQGLGWLSESLLCDQDGEEAHGFFELH